MRSDFGIYVKGEGEDSVYIALYVDDLFLVGRKLGNIEEVKRALVGMAKSGRSSVPFNSHVARRAIVREGWNLPFIH